MNAKGEISAADWKGITETCGECHDVYAARFEPTFLRNHEETYDGRIAVHLEPDFDSDEFPDANDTDQDGLWDGYAYNTSAADWQLTQVVGARCNMTGNLSAHCGEESTYSLYNTSFTSKTNRTSPDSDGDGLTGSVPQPLPAPEEAPHVPPGYAA